MKRGDRVEAWPRLRTERRTIDPDTHQDTRVWTGTVKASTDRATQVRFDDGLTEWLLTAELTVCDTPLPAGAHQCANCGHVTTTEGDA